MRHKLGALGSGQMRQTGLRIAYRRFWNLLFADYEDTELTSGRQVARCLKIPVQLVPSQRVCDLLFRAKTSSVGPYATSFRTCFARTSLISVW